MTGDVRIARMAIFAYLKNGNVSLFRKLEIYPLEFIPLKGGGGDNHGLIQEKKNFSKKIIFRDKIMRGIDCAHRRSVKMLPWFREAKNFFDFYFVQKNLDTSGIWTSDLRDQSAAALLLHTEACM